jgi:hypothetical protein
VGLAINTPVIFTGSLKGLNSGTVGLITSLHSDWCVITYPQNSAYEYDGKNGWKQINGAPNKVYSHSCKLTEVQCA